MNLRIALGYSPAIRAKEGCCWNTIKIVMF